MDGQGLLYVIDQLGKTLAATQAENEGLTAQVKALTDALTAQAQPPDPAHKSGYARTTNHQTNEGR